MTANEFFVQFCKTGASLQADIDGLESDKFSKSNFFGRFCSRVEIHPNCFIAQFPGNCAAVLPLKNPVRWDGKYCFEISGSWTPREAFGRVYYVRT